MSAPQINDVDIPYPSAQQPPELTQAYRGAGKEMADGTVVFQWINASLKRVWRLSWKAISGSDLSALQTAYGTVAGQNSTKWEPSTGGGPYYVTLDPGDPELKVTFVKKYGTTPLYDVQWTLREV